MPQHDSSIDPQPRWGPEFLRLRNSIVSVSRPLFSDFRENFSLSASNVKNRPRPSRRWSFLRVNRGRSVGSQTERERARIFHYTLVPAAWNKNRLRRSALYRRFVTDQRYSVFLLKAIDRFESKAPLTAFFASYI